MSGAFGAFGAFLVKTFRFYVYCKDFTRALLVHFVHLVCFELTSEMSGAFGAFLEKTFRFYLFCTHSTRALRAFHLL